MASKKPESQKPKTKEQEGSRICGVILDHVSRLEISLINNDLDSFFYSFNTIMNGAYQFDEYVNCFRDGIIWYSTAYILDVISLIREGLFDNDLFVVVANIGELKTMMKDSLESFKKES